MDDDVCDRCMRTGVQVNRTDTERGTICVECEQSYDEEEESASARQTDQTLHL